MDDKIANYDGLVKPRQFVSPIWHFCFKSVEKETAQNCFRCINCRKILHNKWYDKLKTYWNDIESECIVCRTISFQSSNWLIWNDSGGWVIPVTVSQPIHNNPMLQASSGGAPSSIMLYMHYPCYQGYAASYRWQEPSRLIIDGRVPPILQSDTTFICDLWTTPLTSQDVIKKEWFIKNVNTIWIHGTYQNQLSVEWKKWIEQYFNAWINQGKRDPLNFTIKVPMILNEDIADRREAYFKPDYSQLPNYELISLKKREYKEMTIKDEDVQVYKNFNIFVGQLENQDSVSDSNSSPKFKIRLDGRPLRAPKPKKHFDDEYPPDQNSPKRKKNLNLNSSKGDSIIDQSIVLSK